MELFIPTTFFKIPILCPTQVNLQYFIKAKNPPKHKALFCTYSSSSMFHPHFITEFYHSHLQNRYILVPSSPTAMLVLVSVTFFLYNRCVCYSCSSCCFCIMYSQPSSTCNTFPYHLKKFHPTLLLVY